MTPSYPIQVCTTKDAYPCFIQRKTFIVLVVHSFFAATIALSLLPPITISPLPVLVVALPPILVCFCCYVVHHCYELVILHQHFFCRSSRRWRSVSFVFVIDTACSFALSSSDSRLLVYSIMVCWLEGGIWLVVMLVGGLDDAFLTTVASALRVQEARLLEFSYPTVRMTRSFLNFSLLL